MWSRIRKVLVLAVMALIVCTSGCNPREMPGFKQMAKRQEEKTTRETEEAIKKSPALQELDRLCTQEIPRPAGFVPINKYRDLHGERFLGYGYHSPDDYPSVKSFYIKYFSEHGWQLTKQMESSWGQPQIEFRRGPFLARIYDLGGREIKYSLHCEKVSEAIGGTP